MNELGIDEKNDILINLDSILEKSKKSHVTRILYKGNYLNLVNSDLEVTSELDNSGFCVQSVIIKIVGIRKECMSLK